MEASAMMRLLVNDHLTCLPGTKTFWHDLQEWFGMEFVGGDYGELAGIAQKRVESGGASLIIRNASWFPPINGGIPTISLLQDILEGAQREMQQKVMDTSRAMVFNSKFTKHKFTSDVEQKYKWTDGLLEQARAPVIPLPVDFSLFEPGNAMGLQQALSLPDGCVCWIGACQDAAGQIKGWDTFLSIVRQNPDIPFVAVFKDQPPDDCPPNMRMFTRLPHEELVKVIGACRVGLCTSRTETQHLAGIEMGACGLPMVAPEVGTYWKRDNIPGILVDMEGTPENYFSAIRFATKEADDPQQIRSYWQKEFDRPVIKAAWTKLIEEAECSGQS